jgi:hypothetical protein
MKKLNLIYNNNVLKRAVGEELKKTAEVITHTGIFDNLDKLYGKKEGEAAGAPTEGGVNRYRRRTRTTVRFRRIRRYGRRITGTT